MSPIKDLYRREKKNKRNDQALSSLGASGKTSATYFFYIFFFYFEAKSSPRTVVIDTIYARDKGYKQIWFL